MVIAVSVQEAETRLSEQLRETEAGSEVVIQRSGRPVARLVPIECVVRDFSEPLMPELGPVDVSPLFENLSAEELALWEGSAGAVGDVSGA